MVYCIELRVFEGISRSVVVSMESECGPQRSESVERWKMRNQQTLFHQVNQQISF